MRVHVVLHEAHDEDNDSSVRVMNVYADEERANRVVAIERAMPDHPEDNYWYQSVDVVGLEGRKA